MTSEVGAYVLCGLVLWVMATVWLVEVVVPWVVSACRETSAARKAEFDTQRKRLSWKVTDADGIKPPRSSAPMRALETPRARRRQVLTMRPKSSNGSHVA